MKFPCITKGFAVAFSLAIIAGCSNDHALMNPENPAIRQSLAKLHFTSSVGSGTAKVFRAAAPADTFIKILNESHDLKLGLWWMTPIESTGGFMLSEAVSKVTPQWPLSFDVDIFDVPTDNQLFSIDSLDPSKKIALALPVLFNDGNKDDVFNLLEEALTDKTEEDTSCHMEAQEALWFGRSAGKDWLVGTPSLCGLLYCPDEATAQLINNGLPTFFIHNAGKVYHVSNVHAGYNILQAENFVERVQEHCDGQTSIILGTTQYKSIDLRTPIELCLLSCFGDIRTIDFERFPQR